MKIVQCFMIVGIVAASYPFIMSLGPPTHLRNAEYRRFHTALELDVSLMKRGELITVAWQGLPVGIYRRTTEEILNISRLNDRVFDPNSSFQDVLPSWWRKASVDLDSSYINSAGRSENIEFFVFHRVSPFYGCQVDFVPRELAHEYHLPDWWVGGFFDRCKAIAFDVSGRAFKGQGFFRHLLIPPYKFKDKQTIVLIPSG